ncbi:MAG: hypothetical protein E7171_04930 [Firmicutes bacterium]|nr:hypothetical protein [Bacillota bacterium]
MAKKKSKTQKSKQNLKKKIKNTQNSTSTTKKEATKTTPKTNNVPKKNNTPKKDSNKPEIKKEQPKQVKSKQVVKKEEVKYNVALDKIKNEEKPKKEKQLVDKDKVKYNVVLTEPETIKKKEHTLEEPQKKKFNLKEKLNTISTKVKGFFSKFKKNKVEEKKPKKYVKKDKKNKKPEEVKPKNIILRAFYELKKNLHIIFNVALIITYIILLIGLIRTNAFSKGTIIYVSCIAIFLIIVATSYTKYISGKIFSILILSAMIYGIYNIQYTYDFINNLNSNEYEYKTYYVVTFNNGQNKSIYNINNKKVCLLKDNSKNIKRKLDTKLDSVKYVEHEDPNKLYSDFYNTECRAIIVNENQYKYLTNNIEPNHRNIKILYEFKANGRK